jgi:glycosyltransferase involved in cell wall biosynthesis
MAQSVTVFLEYANPEEQSIYIRINRNPQNKKMRTICIIPALNEGATIGDIIDDVMCYVDAVIVVDDGSHDDTSSISLDHGAKVVRHPKNLGVGSAFSTGVREALTAGADAMVTIDADGQFRPEDIPRLLSPISDGSADFVTGTRFASESGYKTTSRMKSYGNRLFTRIVNGLVGYDFTDTQCGFRAYSREALLCLTNFGRFTYTQEVFLNLASKNLRMVEVPIEISPRKVGKSRVVKNPFHYGLRAMKIIIQFERDYHPLRFFGIISLLFLVPGLGMLMIVMVNWLITGMSTPYTSLIMIGGILTLVAIIFFILALIADMNGRQRLLQEETLYLTRKQYYDRIKGEGDS